MLMQIIKQRKKQIRGNIVIRKTPKRTVYRQGSQYTEEKGKRIKVNVRVERKRTFHETIGKEETSKSKI